MKTYFRQTASILLIVVLNACATYNAQYKNENSVSEQPNEEISQTLYLVGGAGQTTDQSKPDVLADLKEELAKATKNSTVLFLGNNIYPAGMPKKEASNRMNAEQQLRFQADAVTDFSGKTIFIPGTFDWKSEGPKGLKRQESFIKEVVGKNKFIPENGCPIEKININEDVVLIVIDSEWYITKWDKYPTMNDDCEFRTRSKFFDEFESLVKKARGKTTIIAMHHPMFSNGLHGGQYSFGQHMTPLPILGTVKNVIRRTSGISPSDSQHVRYDELKDRLLTLAQENDKVIFVSGHETSLQYLVEDGFPQIISGSGSATSQTRNVGGGQFSYGTQGYAKLDIYKNGSSYVSFYSSEKNAVVFTSPVYNIDKEPVTKYALNYPERKTASIYSKEETEKTGFYKWFWGDRYREAFSTKIEVPTVNLDTLFGGLVPVRKGGGHQSNSIRFENKEGKEFIMRALRKNGVQYLQSMFNEQYIREDFEGTKVEGLTMDFFTASHPYIPFTTGVLSDAVGIYHTNPELYYVPKQKAIGKYNNEYGDELYMIEERAADGHGDQASFGFSNKLISTHDLLENLRKNELHNVDETAYIRARLFDMLIGDWDRHHDQWRWAEFKDNGETIYKPVPRDRDQAFSLMDDGFITKLATILVPPLRIINSYNEELKAVKWFNTEPYPLDVALMSRSDWSVWKEEANYITSHLTDTAIEEAFSLFPPEVNAETIQEIKSKLQGRRTHLMEIAQTYYKVVNKYAIVKGTDKDDWFDIERMPDGQTGITGYRIKKGEKGEVFYQRTFNREATKEIWVYGLDDDDHFDVHGEGNNYIKLRIVGGLNKDTYNILSGQKTHIYDFKSKENTLLTKKGIQHIRDDYEINNYDYKKPKYGSNVLIPILGSNPDQGFKIGFVNNYTGYGFDRNPFTSQHHLAASYFSATNGYDIVYVGEFANVVGNWNLLVDGKFASPNSSVNFFGFGNSTTNPNVENDDLFDKDYNRVPLGKIGVQTGLLWRGENNGFFKIGVNYESIKLGATEDRFINTIVTTNDLQETTDNFIGAEALYSFQNKDNDAFPTLGFQTDFTLGVKSNTNSNKTYAYLKPSLGFNHRLEPSGQLVFATQSKAHLNIGDDFEFYQAATLGADSGLRGYRNQRFSGKTSFYQSSDLRLNFRRYKTSIIPIEMGIYSGFDIGRVWVSDNLVMDPDFNLDRWNTSVGGGFFINGADIVTGNIALFSSADGVLFSFALGFNF